MEVNKNEAGFKVKKITDLSRIVSDPTVDGFIPESDLTIQHEQFVIQYEYIKGEEQKKESVKPGVYSLISTTSGVGVVPLELRQSNILVDAANTAKIINEAETFFKNLHIYKELEQPQKRGVLLYGVPGCGKTASTSYFCQNMVNQDKGTVVLNWPTDQVKASDVSKFLSTFTEFTTECTKLILIMEDIGGGARDYNGDRGVTTSLLNMLDGVDFVFRLPTFIISTTNNAENVLGSLIDRPQRFDLVMELLPPDAEGRVALTEFISKRKLTEEETVAISDKSVNGFSIAHLKEIVIRARLHDKSFDVVIKELLAHKTKYKNGFEEKKNLGFSSRFED